MVNKDYCHHRKLKYIFKNKEGKRYYVCQLCGNCTSEDRIKDWHIVLLPKYELERMLKVEGNNGK